jgi:hypothetical protein
MVPVRGDLLMLLAIGWVECGTVGEIASELMMDTRTQAIADDDYEEKDEGDNNDDE